MGEMDIDQFAVLEEKIDQLVGMVTSLREEKESFAEKVRAQDQRINELTQELETLRRGRDKAKERIAALLEKIEQAGL